MSGEFTHPKWWKVGNRAVRLSLSMGMVDEPVL